MYFDCRSFIHLRPFGNQCKSAPMTRSSAKWLSFKLAKKEERIFEYEWRKKKHECWGRQRRSEREARSWSSSNSAMPSFLMRPSKKQPASGWRANAGHQATTWEVPEAIDPYFFSLNEQYWIQTGFQKWRSALTLNKNRYKRWSQKMGWLASGDNRLDCRKFCNEKKCRWMKLNNAF